jgi:hypothetical protein
VRQHHPPDRAEPREHVTAAHQHDSRACTLDHVASVRDDELEHAMPNFERSEFEAMHDPAGNPDEDDDSDPHPDCDAGSTRRPRREQHERRMIAGNRAGRSSRRDPDGGGPARCEHERRGCNRSHPAAGWRSRAIVGLPRRSRTKPAGRASTVAVALPAFVIVIVRLAAPVNRMRTGETESAAATPTAAAITGRSP